jgi:hypothetical protein
MCGKGQETSVPRFGDQSGEGVVARTGFEPVTP